MLLIKAHILSFRASSRDAAQNSFLDLDAFTLGEFIQLFLRFMSYSICLLCMCSLAQLCPTLCDPMDCSPPGSSVHGILQARILEWVALPFSRGFSQPRDQAHISCVSCIGRRVLDHQRHLGSPVCTLCFRAIYPQKSRPVLL